MLCSSTQDLYTITLLLTPKATRFNFLHTQKSCFSCQAEMPKYVVSRRESTHSELRLPRRVLPNEILIGIRKYYSFDVHITSLNFNYLEKRVHYICTKVIENNKLRNWRSLDYIEAHKIWKKLLHGFDKSADLPSKRKRQSHEEDFFKLCMLYKKSDFYKISIMNAIIFTMFNRVWNWCRF